MRRAAFWASIVVPAIAVVCVIWCGSFPLGVAGGEWEWNRIEQGGSLAVALLPPLVAALLFVGVVWLGARRIERCHAVELSAWLGGLVVCGFTWLWIVQESAPEPYQLSKAAWVLYFRGSSGYFSEARESARDLPLYLAGYEHKMAEGDVLHIGTHPPGLVIAFRALLDACTSFPVLTDLALATEPDSLATSFDELRRLNALSRTDRAVLWLAALLVQAGAALTVIPLFGILRHTSSRRASWLAAAFWPTIPALALFIPKSDCLYPLLTMGFLGLWLTGLARRSRALCLLAGATFWLGMMLSLVFLPLAFLALLATIANFLRLPARAPRGSPAETSAAEPEPLPGRPDRTGHFRGCVSATAWAAFGFFVPSLAAWLWLKLNLPEIWWLNLHNHAGFYREYPRTYWKWLLVNPVEFVVAAGVPLAVLAAWSIAGELQRSRFRPAGHVAGWLATIGVLWLSGKNMGEAARLWIFLMPFLVWIAGPMFDTPAGAVQNADRRSPSPGCDSFANSGWAAALAVQLVTTIAIVTRVVGFHYP